MTFPIYSKLATAKTRVALTALLVFLLPFERIPSINVFSVTLRASQFVALALIIVSIGPIIDFYRSKPRLPKLLLPAFLFSYFLSALMATDIKRAMTITIFTVFVALMASAIAATIRPRDLSLLEKALFITTAIVIAFGFYQYLGDVFGLSASLTGLRPIYTKEIFGFPRIQSTALEPLFYGSFLLIPYLILLAKRLLYAKSFSKYHGVLFLLVITQLFLTVSRGAIYAGIVATIVLLVGLGIQKKIQLYMGIRLIGYIVIGAGLALILTWLPTYFVKQPEVGGAQKTEKLLKQTSNFDSQDDRVRNRQLAIDAFKTTPVFGIGPGNFSNYAVSRYPAYSQVAPVSVNNEPLELAAEAGVIGFSLFVLYVGWTYVMVFGRYLKRSFNNEHAAYWVPAVLVYMIALAIQYQTFSTLYVMHVWVIIGLLIAFSGQHKKVTE